MREFKWIITIPPLGRGKLTGIERTITVPRKYGGQVFDSTKFKQDYGIPQDYPLFVNCQITPPPYNKLKKLRNNG